MTTADIGVEAASALTSTLKEWAVVCAALERGEQAILLRKGGIVEQTGEFEIEQRRFLLFPTTFHPAREQVRRDYWPLLEQVEAEAPPPGTLRLGAWAEAVASRPIERVETARALAAHTVWTPDYLEDRFTMQKHRTLQLVMLRVHRLPAPRLIERRRSYAGCTSWVDVEAPIATAGSVPALDDAAFAALLGHIDATVEGRG